MNLYEAQINSLKDIFFSIMTTPSKNGFSESRGVNYYSEGLSWPLQEKEDLILKSHMAFELGGGNACAASGILFTTGNNSVTENGVYVNTNDLAEFCQDSNAEINYARVVVVKLKEEAVKNRTNQQLYAIFRKLEYQRYHSFLKGVGTRVSSMQNREVLRVSKSAVEEGISLSKMGNAFLQSFLCLPEVDKVQVYIAASKTPPLENFFEEVRKITEKGDFITNSLNEIFKGLKMDCSVCGQKALCDEISGIKEIHQAQSK